MEQFTEINSIQKLLHSICFTLLSGLDLPDSFRILVCVTTAMTSFLVVSFSSTVWMSILGNVYINMCLCVCVSLICHCAE